MSLATVTRHVQTLERWGLIRTHKTGRVRVCWLEPQALDRLDQWVAYPRSRWERRPSRGWAGGAPSAQRGRSEEPTSELQSPCNLVCRLLLEKKNSKYSSRAARHLVRVNSPHQNNIH